MHRFYSVSCCNRVLRLQRENFLKNLPDKHQSKQRGRWTMGAGGPRGPGKEDENALVEALKRGDLSAWAAVYNTHRDRVYGLLLRILKSPDRAEDLTQDVFVKVYVSAPSFL